MAITVGELPTFNVRKSERRLAKGTVSVLSVLSVLGVGLLIALGGKKTGGFQAVYIHHVRPPSDVCWLTKAPVTIVICVP